MADDKKTHRELAAQNLKDAITFMPEESILKYFSFEHLPERLQWVSALFAELATELVDAAPRCPERTVALRKLLEGKDAAVRALL